MNGTVTVTVTNTYDNLNRLISTVTGGRTMIYTYDGEGKRVGKSIDGTLTRYLYEYDKVVLETDASGNQSSRNVYGTNLLMRNVGGESYCYMYNGHADVTALLRMNGTIAATYYYDVFGNILEQTGNVSNNINYAGYQYDSETGLYYLNSRYYDSKIARFLSEDTYGGQANDPLSLNLYTYCHNEPIMYTDPTGHIAMAYDGSSGKANISLKGRIALATKTVVKAVETVVAKVKEVLPKPAPVQQKQTNTPATPAAPKGASNNGYQYASDYRSSITNPLGTGNTAFGDYYFQGIKDTLIGQAKMGDMITNDPLKAAIVIPLQINPVILVISTNVDFVNNVVLGDTESRAKYLGGTTVQLAESAITYGIAKGVAKIGTSIKGVASAEAATAEGTTKAVEGFKPSETYINSKGQITNGKYIIDEAGMAPHKTGSTTSGKGQFLYGVDAETATLDAAAYADANNLWVGNKAKVPVTNGMIGVTGKTGQLTNYINVYKTNTGFVHASPGNP